MEDAVKSFLRGPVGAWLISLYLRFVSLTSRHIHDGPTLDIADGTPVIYATWHGQNFIFAFWFRRRNYPHLMVALHGDGKMVGQAMAYLGVPLVYGSGTTDETQRGKGGAKALLQMIRALKAGHSVTLTADVPKNAREVGDGILVMARKSGAAIVPVAMTTSRRRILPTWDAMQWNKPFSKMVFAHAEALHVPNDGSDLESYRAALKSALEEAQSRAFALADGKVAR